LVTGTVDAGNDPGTLSLYVRLDDKRSALEDRTEEITMGVRRAFKAVMGAAVLGGALFAVAPVTARAAGDAYCVVGATPTS
jgi:hypothetical protein